MDKLADLSTLLEEAGRDIPIEIDGGVGPENTAEIVAAGATMLVAGSAIFGNPPYGEVISRMKEEGGKVRS